MEEQFVPYDIALKLKELGFNEHCFASYTNKDLSFVRELFGDVIASRYSINNDVDYSTEITAPLFSQVFEFFRSKQLQSHISFGLVFSFVINNQSYEDYPNEGDNWFRTYREAEIACINKLIELVYDK